MTYTVYILKEGIKHVHATDLVFMEAEQIVDNLAEEGIHGWYAYTNPPDYMENALTRYITSVKIN